MIAVTLLAGCGLTHKKTPPGELALERADFLTLVHGLQGLEGALQSSRAASFSAWPYVANGLSRDPAKRGHEQVAQAAAAAAAIKLPAVLEEADTQALTGPSSPIAGVFRTFIGLVPRGWQLIGAAISELEDGPAVARAYARETVALYIESVYDGYFSLAQVGKKVTAAYKALEGPGAFAGVLSSAEVEALASFYSEPTFRLEPHPGVKLGS